MIATLETIMRKLVVFNNVTLDGYFVDAQGDMRWAHNPKPDPEWDAFVGANAGGGGVLVFGRVTYELMASYWPTPMAAQNAPSVAEGMNRSEKIVFSRTLEAASWNNTKLVKSDPGAEIRKLKNEPGGGMCVLGSGTIVAQLAEQGLVDEYNLVVVPVVLGKGRTMFDGVKKKLAMKPTKTRAFANGNVLLCYEPVA
jgi:dihydrofolate reductase